MASITHDGRTFTINDRRRWLVGATIDLGRHDRRSWPALLDTIRHAGFNTIGLRLAWALHEPEPGAFDFTGDLDAAAFVRAAAQRRLFVLLRPGPYVGAGFDAGGLPGWLVDGRPGIVRTGDGVFREAVSRWFTALLREVGDLQLLSRGAGGPIVLVQNEHAYFKGSEALADEYLTETARFLREAGVRVPILNANNLFAAAEGELDGWLADDEGFATIRQLRVVRPQSPPMLLDLPLAERSAFGAPLTRPAPDASARRFAEALAAGGQVFVDAAAAGLSPGFSAGRDGREPSRIFTPASCPLAPIDHAGAPTPRLAPIARLASFATFFERLLTAIDWAEAQPVVPAPGSPDGDAAVSLWGELGGVVFLFPNGRGAGPRTLVLPDGRSIEVAVAGLPAVPLLLDVRLGARAVLDHCSFPALAALGEVFVCYGPPGTRGVISIDGAELRTSAPAGTSPTVIEHAGVTVVILNTDHAAGAAVLDDVITLPAAGLTFRRTGEAVESAPEVRVSPASSRPRAPRLSAWASAADPAPTDADDAGWIPIDAPAPHAALPPMTGGADGYRWLRAVFTAGKTARGSLGFLDLNDRAHVWLDGEPFALVGDGPDTATRAVPTALGKGEHTLTLLVGHLGRPDAGGMIGEPVGLAAAPRFVAALRLNKPKLVTAEPIHPVRALPARVWELHDDDPADPSRIEWRFTYRRTAPVHLRIESFPEPAPALAILNDQPFLWLTPGDHASVALPADALRRGINRLQFAVVGDAARALAPIAKAVSLSESKADLPGTPAWAARPWAPPPEACFEPVRAGARRCASGPVWLRASFTHTPDDPPIALAPAGRRTGAVMVNGRVLGRTLTLPRSRTTPTPIPIPPSALRADEPNELLIFDEFGAGPGSSRLVTL